MPVRQLGAPQICRFTTVTHLVWPHLLQRTYTHTHKHAHKQEHDKNRISPAESQDGDGRSACRYASAAGWYDGILWRQSEGRGGGVQQSIVARFRYCCFGVVTATTTVYHSDECSGWGATAAAYVWAYINFRRFFLYLFYNHRHPHLTSGRWLSWSVQ